jgi:D-tyrosyl-tRNA(Tyr) deacylase
MRALLQRVTRAEVRVEGEVTGRIGRGLCCFFGVGADDTERDVAPFVERIAQLRIFEDEVGKMNRSLLDVGGALLSVSQFTLYADTSRGRRPSFTGAMEPKRARELWEASVAHARNLGLEVATGRFGADMQVELVNDGPVTLWLDSRGVASEP